MGATLERARATALLATVAAHAQPRDKGDPERPRGALYVSVETWGPLFTRFVSRVVSRRRTQVREERCALSEEGADLERRRAAGAARRKFRWGFERG